MSQTVTLVLTDLAGSTRLWAEYPDLMSAVMGRHHAIVHAAITGNGGWRPVDQGEGDAVFAAFDSATAAVAAVVRFQQELAAEPWPTGIDIRVRVGVHTGEVTVRDGNLFGSTVNRCARLRGLGAGGQVLLSAPTWELVRDRLPDGVAVTDLGEHRMKDLTRPEHVHQLLIPGLPTEFPALASLDRAQHNLPIQTSSFLGRDREVADLVEMVGRERLVTITGFGGMGKTRLALQVAAELATGDGDGVWFIDLSAVTDPAAVPLLIAATLGIAEGADGPLPALLTGLKDQRLLLVLDNLEQLLPDAATLVDQLARTGPSIRILATCREPLRVGGEHEYPLRPLALPTSVRPGTVLTDAEVAKLSTYAAVTLFIARATAARPDFVLTPANAAAVAAVCARLDGLPLALELAAARTRSLSPEALLPRLDRALKVLTGGSRDLPARHRTLRATIAWSYDALSSNEQQLLDRLSVFPGSFTLDAAEAVCGPAFTDDSDDLDVLDGIGVLVDRSLVRHHLPSENQTDDRYDLLGSIRDYADERLSAAGETVTLAAQHAEYYRTITDPGRDWTWADLSRRRRVVLADLHNVRAALDHTHVLGAPAQELRLAHALTIVLAILGQQADARAVADRTLARAEQTSPDRSRLLVNRGMIDQHAERDAEARRWFEMAMAEAREAGDAAVLINAISAVGLTATSAAQAQQLMAEGEALLASLPATGDSLPRWYCAWMLDDFLAKSRYTEPDRAIAAQRRLVESVPVDDVPFERLNLAILLFNQGRLAEAEDLLAPFEHRDGVSGAEPSTQTKGVYLAALMRVATGNLTAAHADAELTAQRLRAVDLPDIVARVAYLQAVLARASGDSVTAVRTVRAFLRDFGGSPDRGPVAAARYLLAVLSREAGDLATASAQLEEAWTAALDEGIEAPDQILECLLERAHLLTAADPAEAARLIGLVAANRGTEPFTDGVTYDTDAMLDGLRARLGATEVDRILADTVDQPLPNSPDWTYIDDGRVEPE